VLANGRCDVLKGQCIRSGAGLYYENYQEFSETLYSLESNGPLHARLGRNGREYFTRNYTWPVIERKYLDMLERLQRERETRPLEPLGNWLARHRRRLRAAADVLASLPAGAVVPDPGPDIAVSASAPDSFEGRDAGSKRLAADRQRRFAHGRFRRRRPDGFAARRGPRS
jgi:hypothetical protein